MADAVVDIAAIRDRETLNAYLRTRPVDEWRVLALRCAARVMPLAPIYLNGGLRDRQQLTLVVFRGLFFSWAACRYPGYNQVFGAGYANNARFAFSADADAAAARAAFGFETWVAAADAVAAAVDAVTVALRDADAEASDAADENSLSVRAAIWAVVRADLLRMQETSTNACLVRPLWAKGNAPEIVVKREAVFNATLDAFGPDWSVVPAFYQALREGLSPFSNLGDGLVHAALALAEEDEAFWKRDPDLVMRDLAERLGGGQTPRQPEAASNAQSEKVDFFISYSTKNEAEAREINGYLEDAGYSTIVQFKDFAVGSNFVTEMQKGLQAERMVGLLSPAYVASKQCQAEWNAAYNRDPSGEQRYLVSILVEKTELPPLAKQIVYKSLVGLSGYARRKAVLEAIGKLRRPEVPDVRSPYEYELTPNQTITAVGGAMNTVSVLPSRDPNDARKRLEAAKQLANDLIAGLMDNRFQVGRHYIKELENYRDRLPLDATESIYSADAALRNLRDDLENDMRNGICDRFAPRLQRLIEAHYGLRVYFPELLNFYDDVKQARQAEPPPLEALGKLRQIVADNTPDVFEPSVDAAFGHAVDVARQATEKQEASTDGGVSSSAPTTLPPDPIADIDPVRAAQHAEISMQNRIWGVLRRIEEGGKTVERVDKAISSYAKWIDPILDWLSKSG